MVNLPTRTYAQISLPCISHNLETVRALLSPGCKIMSVLKADAYGHGATGCLPAFEGLTDWYAVATIEEALALRQGGAQKEILLFGSLPPVFLEEVIKNHITVTVHSREEAVLLDRLSETAGHRLCVHIKVDTGLNRTGFFCRDTCMDICEAEIHWVYAAKNLCVTGIYTHFACSDSEDPDDAAFTRMQFSLFHALCGRLEKAGAALGLRHCCSSAATVRYREYALDMVRVGMLPLGQCMTEEERIVLGLRPALCWRAAVMFVRSVLAGESIGYGRAWRAAADSTIAVVSAGYADGYRRSYSGRTHVLLHGQRAPVVGTVCMDYLMADVTAIPGVAPGEWATLLGEADKAVIAPNELARCESVNGEVTAAISARVPRIFLRSHSSHPGA